MGRDAARLLIALLLTPAALASTASAQTPSAADIARGKYVFGATGGCGCHTVPKQPVNAGGRKYDGPFGTVYSTNITPDRETGIGGWTDEQIITATRLGRRPNGERLIPVHPYTTFNGMTADDLKALIAFLRTVPPVKRANQAAVCPSTMMSETAKCASGKASSHPARNCLNAAMPVRSPIGVWST